MRPPSIVLVCALLSSAIVAALPPSPAPAGGSTITVDETADELNADGDCSLREAMKAARENVAVDSCPPGHFAGPDTIVLESGATYELSIEGDGSDEGDLNTGGTGANPLFIRSEPGPDNAIIDANGIHRVMHVGFGIEVTVNEVTFTGGHSPPASSGGGGIQNRGTLTLISVVVEDNFSEQFGGGIANRLDDTLIVEDSLITDNVANQDGGGISNAGQLSVSGSTIMGNTTEENSGGGISTGGQASIEDSIISDNHALDGSGGGISNHETLTVERSLITANSASGRGGGIHSGTTSNEETADLTNVTVSGNTASSAGGIEDGGEGMTLVNVTIANNLATNPGSPDNLRTTFAGVIEVTNTIISNTETAPATVGINNNCSGEIVTGGNNLASDDSCGLDPVMDDIINADPLLGPLADNGGPAETHALLEGSPALSAADDAACPPVDQRGETRPQGDGCDIGAYESDLTAPTPTPTPSPTPTSAPGPDLIQGDNDCDTTDEEDPDVDAVDALTALQFVAALPFQQEPGCPQIGAPLPAALPAGESPDSFGDMDCDGDVDAVDALQILRFVAALPVAQDEPCTDIGDPL